MMLAEESDRKLYIDITPFCHSHFWSPILFVSLHTLYDEDFEEMLPVTGLLTPYLSPCDGPVGTPCSARRLVIQFRDGQNRRLLRVFPRRLLQRLSVELDARRRRLDAPHRHISERVAVRVTASSSSRQSAVSGRELRVRLVSEYAPRIIPMGLCPKPT